jgi:hypothetical protein
MNVLRLSASVYSRSYPYLKGGPGHFFMYVLGRFRAIRLAMVGIYSLKRDVPSSTTSQANYIEDVDVDVAVRTIAKDGFVHGLRLRPEAVEQLLTFSNMATCFGDGRTDYPFNYRDREAAEQQFGKKFRLGRYNHACLASPALQALTTDRQLLAIARKYLRTTPVLLGARMWWSFPGPAATEEQKKAGQGFHYDIDGYRALTFFFYLTDVGMANGPHVYIRGSHVKKRLKHLVSMYKGRSDEEILEAYGPERQVVSCGPVGSGFAEDIFGFHKGLSPESGDRLIVQVRYGLRDYGTGRHD